MNTFKIMDPVLYTERGTLPSGHSVELEGEFYILAARAISTGLGVEVLYDLSTVPVTTEAAPTAAYKGIRARQLKSALE